MPPNVILKFYSFIKQPLSPITKLTSILWLPEIILLYKSLTTYIGHTSVRVKLIPFHHSTPFSSNCI
nr:MAG TPA: hypothetical protein [Caudoviricetes sp.]